MSRIERQPIDLNLVSHLIHDEVASILTVSIDQVSQVVARHFGLRSRDLRSASRRAALVEARHLAILIAREVTGASYATLGKAFGGRDPKTIRHACLAASRRETEDPTFAAAAKVIRSQWQRKTR